MKMSELKEMLNKKLGEELDSFIQERSLKNFHLINQYEKFCGILMNLLTEEILTPNEILFSEGDISSKIYFINTGQVIIYDESTNLIYNKLEVKFQ